MWCGTVFDAEGKKMLQRDFITRLTGAAKRSKGQGNEAS
jgi:hypothetical protein